jgi:methyltransferase (TIGR00027 family)
VPRIYRYPYPGEPPFKHQPAARTTYFDAALDRHVDHVEQLVILGAGFDTRAYRLRERSRLRSFEIDSPKTQAFKREMLKRAEVDTTGITYVPVDFLKEDWVDKLVNAGFRRDRTSFFLWESVTMYLDRETVENTLRKIAQMATGNVIAFDYLSTEIIEARTLSMRYIRAVLRATGEPWRFGMDSTGLSPRGIADFVGSFGFSLEEQRNFGLETKRNHAMAGFATAIRKPSMTHR